MARSILIYFNIAAMREHGEVYIKTSLGVTIETLERWMHQQFLFNLISRTHSFHIFNPDPNPGVSLIYVLSLNCNYTADIQYKGTQNAFPSGSNI